MELKELKEKILNKSLQFNLLIFKYEDDTWLVNQYIDEISKVLGLNINYVADLDTLSNLNADFFMGDYSNDLNVVWIEELSTNIANKEDLTTSIIKVNKIDKDIEKELKDYIIKFPKLSDWQLEDYANIELKGMKEDAIKWLSNLIGTDAYRLDNEIDKITIFDEKDRMNMFLSLNQDGCYSDLNNFNIFNFISAIVKRDYTNVIGILKIRDTIDLEPMGLITLLTRQFKNIIDIQLGNNPTPDKLGLQPKQFNAIKYSCGKFSSDRLIYIYDLLTGIDYRLKSGLLDNDKIIDYVICNIMR